MSPVIQVSFEMARAETIESVGETGIGRNGLFPQHNTCWPGLLSSATITISSGTGNSPMQLHHHGHSLQPLQAVCVSYPSFYLHPENQDQPSSHQQSPTLSSAPHPLLLHNQGEEADEGFPGEQPGKNYAFNYSTIITNIACILCSCWSILKVQ